MLFLWANNFDIAFTMSIEYVCLTNFVISASEDEKEEKEWRFILFQAENVHPMTKEDVYIQTQIQTVPDGDVISPCLHSQLSFYTLPNTPVLYPVRPSAFQYHLLQLHPIFSAQNKQTKKATFKWNESGENWIIKGIRIKLLACL